MLCAADSAEDDSASVCNSERHDSIQHPAGRREVHVAMGATHRECTAAHRGTAGLLCLTSGELSCLMGQHQRECATGRLCALHHAATARERVSQWTIPGHTGTAMSVFKVFVVAAYGTNTYLYSLGMLIGDEERPCRVTESSCSEYVL